MPGGIRISGRGAGEDEVLAVRAPEGARSARSWDRRRRADGCSLPVSLLYQASTPRVG